MGRVWDWLSATETLDPPTPNGNGHAELRAETYPLSDPAFAEWMGWGSGIYAGKSVTEDSALGLTAVFRAVAIIAGTIAGLPLKSYKTLPDGTRKRVDTWVDGIGDGAGMTPFEFVELMLVHLLLHGNFFGVHLFNGAGAVAALQPIHPDAVMVKPVETDDEKRRFAPAWKYFQITLKDGGQRDFSPAELCHITGLCTDGLRGLSLIRTLRQAIGTGLAADEAAGRIFSNGMLVGGLVTTKEDVTVDEAKIIKADFVARTQGAKNAGDIAFVNRQLEFSPWTQTAAEAQFNESRSFQIEEICRAFGIPPHLVGLTEKQTSWGTGVSEQNRGLARYTLAPWTTRIEQRLSRLLTRPTICEFDYAGLLQSSPKEELEMLALQIDKGILTLDEVRRIRNLPPLEAPAPAMEETDG